jgi:hypothetical protein
VSRDGEHGLGVDGHLRLGTGAGMFRKELVVVQDPPVVDADDGPVPDRMVVRIDRGMPLREVADVDQELGRPGGNGDLLEQLRCRSALLDDDGGAGARVRVADRIRSTLRDRGQERLRGEGAIEPRVGCEAVSGDSAHKWWILGFRTDDRPGGWSR